MGTIIVLVILIAVVSFVIYKMFKAKKSGKGGCSCGCGTCPNSSVCHSKESNK